VRTVYLPKPGGGTRRLGIPTVLDRFIAQAILQGLGPLVDPGFSARSSGFRPGRSAHQALPHMGHDSEAGDRWVVNLDLETCFDRVKPDMVRSRGARKVKDKRLLKLLRRYLNAGLRQDGVVSQRAAGMPQGSPLAPRLSHGRWDDFDQELERRGHRFCRYADDANGYVRSQRAGARVMASRTRCLEERLRLQGNRSKSVVARPGHGTCLGDTVTNPLRPRVKPAPRSVTRAKDRLRQSTHQGRGRHSRTVITAINRFTRGGVGDVRLSTVNHQCEGRDQGLRRRFRKIWWEQWRRPRTRDRTLVARGREVERARKATATGRGAWWKAGASHRHAAVNTRVLAAWGLVRLRAQRRDLERST
jgi:RNA-directed DNA polymerase